MEELKTIVMYVAAGFLAEIILGIVCFSLAKRKGRDTIGWFLAGFCFNLIALVILAMLPSIEVHGFTKHCPGCGSIVPWKDITCRKCGKELGVQERDQRIKVKRPLRSCFLYVALFVLLLLIVFGLIGYFCVPDQPRTHSSIEIVKNS